MPNRRWRSRALVAVSSTLLGLPVAADSATAAQLQPTMAIVARSAHPPLGATPLTPMAATAPMTLSIGLAPRDPAQFAAFTAAVNEPGSSIYHQFLAPGEYATRFGATPTSAAPLIATLRAGGFTVQPFNRRLQLLTVSAPRSTVERFFSVAINRYRDRSGHVGTVALGAPRVPASLRPLMTGVSGLNTLARWTDVGLNHGSRSRSIRSPHVVPAIGSVPTCAAASSAQSSVGGWTTAQLAQAYGFSTAYSRGAFGAGVTVGLYEISAYQQSDLSAYEKCYGITPSVKIVNVDGGAGPYDASTAFEPTLDVEEMLSLAPQANFLIYNGPNNGNGPNDLLAKIASDDKAMVISTSWGICESINGQDPATGQRDPRSPANGSPGSVHRCRVRRQWSSGLLRRFDGRTDATGRRPSIPALRHRSWRHVAAVGCAPQADGLVVEFAQRRGEWWGLLDGVATSSVADPPGHEFPERCGKSHGSRRGDERGPRWGRPRLPRR